VVDERGGSDSARPLAAVGARRTCLTSNEFDGHGGLAAEALPALVGESSQWSAGVRHGGPERGQIGAMSLQRRDRGVQFASGKKSS
jgi:hypothetical protein